jgi:DnaJ-class molecular chaperone
MTHRGKPYSELTRTNLFAFYSIQEIKSWREHEHDLGRPSGLEDFYQAHSLCWECKATGVTISPVDSDGDIRMYEQCELCGGTGKSSRVSEISSRGREDGAE